MEKQLEEIRIHFIECISIDFGPVLVTSRIRNWPSLSWSELLNELADQEINLTSSLNRSWFSFYTLEKAKYNLLELLSSRRNIFDNIISDCTISCN